MRTDIPAVTLAVAEAEDSSPLRLQEDLLAAGLPDGGHLDAHPADWLLHHGTLSPWTHGRRGLSEPTSAG